MNTLTEAAQQGVAVTALDPRRVALRTDENLYVRPDLAAEVWRDHTDSLGISIGDLADYTQGIRDWAFAAGPYENTYQELYIGDGAYLGERWMVYANILRSTRVVRYIGYPMHNSDGSRVEVHTAVTL